MGKSIMNDFFKIFILATILSLTLGAKELTNEERIAQQLEEDAPVIPLKNALGEVEYDQAMESQEYRYVSNAKCRLCHRKFFIGRKNDPHDHAMESLTSNGHENNPKCLTCHTTGYGVETGFTSLERTPRLSNVQCEGCHGPGNVHIDMAKSKNKTKRFSGGGFLAGTDSPDKLKKMCQSCHTKRWNRSYHDLDSTYKYYKQADPNARTEF